MTPKRLSIYEKLWYLNDLFPDGKLEKYQINIYGDVFDSLKKHLCATDEECRFYKLSPEGILFFIDNMKKYWKKLDILLRISFTQKTTAVINIQGYTSIDKDRAFNIHSHKTTIDAIERKIEYSHNTFSETENIDWDKDSGVEYIDGRIISTHPIKVCYDDGRYNLIETTDVQVLPQNIKVMGIRLLQTESKEHFDIRLWDVKSTCPLNFDAMKCKEEVKRDEDYVGTSHFDFKTASGDLKRIYFSQNGIIIPRNVLRYNRVTIPIRKIEEAISFMKEPRTDGKKRINRQKIYIENDNITFLFHRIPSETRYNYENQNRKVNWENIAQKLIDYYEGKDTSPPE